MKYPTYAVLFVKSNSMKKLFLLYCTIAIFINTFGQTSQNLRKVVSLDKESVALNGGLRSYVGGKSRIVIPIDLPANTVEWYYTFSTTSVNSPANELNLVSQLTKLLDLTDPLGLVASAIMSPTGTHVCNIYLMDDPNSKAFLAKMDQKGTKVLCIESAKRENIRNGVVQIKDVKAGRWFLGLRNPTAEEGVVINIEVAAIVEEKDANALQKSSLYGSMGWDAYKDGEIDKCIEFSKKALTLDNTMGWVKLNLGLCYLVKGQQEAAANYYVDAITDIKKLANSLLIQKHLQAGINDIDEALQKKPGLKGTDYIRELLENELNKQQK